MGTFLSSLRISTKLAINAGFAILLVLALAGTTILELRQIAMEGETAARSMRTLESTMEARAARLAMPTLNRDIRMAQDAATVDRALASFDEALAIVQRELAAALASATLPENRARLETAGRETAAIVDANRRVAALRKEHLEIRNAIVFGGGGPLAQAIAAIQAAAPLAGHPEEARIRTLLQQTADALLDARIGGQRYMGSNEPAQRERTLNAGRAAIRDVNAARDLVPPGHPARPGLEDLAHRVQAYITGFERAVNNLDQINRLQEETIAPLQARIDGTMAEVFSAARDRTQQAQANLHEAQARASAIALWLSLAVLLLLAAGAALLARAIARPLRELTGQMGEIAAGRLDITVAHTTRRDEVGDMARALEVFRGNGQKVRALEEGAAAQRAEAEAARRAAAQASADTLERTLGGVVTGLAATATELNASADSLGTTAERTAARAATVAAGAGEASTNVQSVAAAAEELAASIAEITRQVTQAAEVSRRAVAEVQKTDGTVRGLSDGAQRIGDVVRLIGDVAGQTNLLALNATIEAARAGEAGKGFAVVASEVKSLAAQTAKATEEIGQQIKAMQGVSSQAVEAIRAIGQVVAEVDQIAASIAAAVEEQGAVTREIARSVGQAASGTGEVSASIEEVRGGAGETSAAVRQLRGVTEELARQGETLRAEIARVTADLRAA